MAYTRDWDDEVPPGARAAKEIDNAAREFRVDISERIRTLLRAPVDADEPLDDDPLVLLPAYSGAQTDHPLVFGPSGFRAYTDDTSVEFGDGTLSFIRQLSSSSAGVLCDFMIPAGYTIKLVECWGARISNSSIGMQAFSVSVIDGTETALAAVVLRSSESIGLMASVAMDHEMIDTEYVRIRINNTSSSFPKGGTFTAVRITVDRPSNAESY